VLRIHQIFTEQPLADIMRGQLPNPSLEAELSHVRALLRDVLQEDDYEAN
jgi:hypothetical protein